MHAFRLLLASALLGGLLGCSSGGPTATTYDVSGSVNLDGAPLAEGNLYLEGPGPELDILPIAGGKFSGKAQAGLRKVRIVSIYEGTPDPADPTGLKPQLNRVAERFNSGSTLTADVKPEGPNTYSFEVASQ